MSLDRQRIDAVKLLSSLGYSWDLADGWQGKGASKAGEVKVWTFVVSSDSREAPCPEVYATEAEAMAAFDQYMRESWEAYSPSDDDDKALPYPGDPIEAIRWFWKQPDTDFPYGEVQCHLLKLEA